MKKASKAIYAIATVFNAGRLPLCPGTWGSLVGFALCFLLHRYVVIYVLVFLVLFIFGVVSAGRVAKEESVEDPPHVVIDEFACIFPVFFLIPLTPLYIIVGFCVYRLLDIVKIPPIKQLEKARGGWGIMLDDLAGAVYTNLLLHLLLLLK